MNKTISVIGVFLLICVASFAQDDAYYKAIQKKSAAAQMKPAQFKTLEEDAAKNFAHPEPWDSLATAFGNTTGKVWAVIYGEVYCNLSSDQDRVSRIGSLVFSWYEGSLSRSDTGLSISLTANAQASSKGVPFESQFELSFLMSAASLKKDFPPLSIRRLKEIRKNQLSLWDQKKLPRTELVRRLQEIQSAGHFEAYNYWLFKAARTDEFSEWIKDHQTQFQAWLDWQSKNKFEPRTPDFQRLHLLT